MLIFLLCILLKLVLLLLGEMLCFDLSSFTDFSFFKFDGFLLPLNQS